MQFLQVDVFAQSGPYTGNQLAVFPNAAELTSEQMQAIANEMNLSETTFVTEAYDDSYTVRIFTPHEELPFAGHPTLGTGWVLRYHGPLKVNRFRQVSRVGSTWVEVRGDQVWFERTGVVHIDLARRNPAILDKLAQALGIDRSEIGLEARELGRSGRLEPAISNAGYEQTMVPLKDLAALKRCRPDASLLKEIGGEVGVYCFTAEKAGAVRARGFFPAVGVSEDPATGSAAAALGLYLADRIGDIDLDVIQGVEMGRPSRIMLRARGDEVHVGGHCELIFTGRLETLP